MLLIITNNYIVNSVYNNYYIHFILIVIRIFRIIINAIKYKYCAVWLYKFNIVALKTIQLVLS